MKNLFYLCLLQLKKLKWYFPLYFIALGILIFLSKFFNLNFLSLFQLIAMMFLYQRTFDYLYFDGMELFELYSNLNSKWIFLKKYLLVSIIITVITAFAAIILFLFKIEFIKDFLLVTAYCLNLINLALLIADFSKPTYSNYFFYALILLNFFTKFTKYITLNFFDILYSKIYILSPVILLICVLFSLKQKRHSTKNST